MPPSDIADIERRFAGLPHDAQLDLLQRLTRRLYGESEKPDNGWESGLAAMAADPQIQRELQQINSEFQSAEADGLEKS
jgi:hypothetical protein